MIKHYVLDTNVLLHNPNALFLFQDNHVIIPITVIEEIDRFKKELSEIGRNARLTSRHLDTLRTRGNLMKGVALDNGGSLHVDVEKQKDLSLNGLLLEAKSDNRILLVALQEQKRHPEERTILVTKDTNLRIKADALGLEAQDFQNSKVNIDELYTGMVKLEVDGEMIDDLYEDEELTIEDHDLYANQFVHLVDQGDPNHTALARMDNNAQKLVLLKKLKSPIFNIWPRNREQRFAMDLLLDDQVRLVTLVGKAGTGKTLLALAAGLHRTLNDNRYLRLLVSRPIYPLGRELGFLPGDLDAKLKPWMQPIFDNLELLLSSPTDKAAQFTRVSQLRDDGTIEMEALTYIRGRSLPNVYLLIDEAQNLTPHEIKTTVTRVGENTKIVLTGDPYQIDNPYLDASSNGLTYVVERMKGQQMAGHMTLIKGERSPLAELAANIL